MTKNPLSSISYGVYILSSKYEGKSGGCVINTCIQVANTPNRVAVAVMNSSNTRRLIKKSGKFCVAILDETATFEMISHFGYQSGKDVDKFANIASFNDSNGIPCILHNACASISCKVTECINLGSHTIFIGEVKEMLNLSKRRPLTYAEYQARIKPERYTPPEGEDPSDSKKVIVGWQCTICGYVFDIADLPDDITCPVCGHPKEDYVPVYQD